jgi:serine/threonine-protein kinase
VRRLDQLDATAVPDSDGARAPFFSPDGAWIAFFTNDKLKKVEAIGGRPTTVADAPNSRGGTWTEDDWMIFLPRAGGGTSFVRVRPTGGVPEAFITRDAGSSQRWPQLLPGARALLYTRVSPGQEGEIMVQPLPDGERVSVGRGGFARYLPTGHLAFLTNGTLQVAPFDLETLRMTGPAGPMVEGIDSSANDAGQFAVAPSGALVYVAGAAAGGADMPIHWIDASGAVTTLSSQASAWTSPAFSPDGRSLVYSVRGASGGLWVLDLERGATFRLTNNSGDHSPAWTPDSRRLTFTGIRDGDRYPVLYWQAVDGSSGAERLTTGGVHEFAAWHPDGQTLAFRWSDSQSDIHAVTVTPGPGGARSSEPRRLLSTPSAENRTAFSPDGRWMAYTSTESERSEVHVRPYPGPGARVVVSTNGGIFPAWSRARNQLFFGEYDGSGVERTHLMVVDYTVDGGQFRVGTPRRWSPRSLLPRFGQLNYALHPDGARIAALAAPDVPGPQERRDHVVLVQHFLDEVRRLVSSGR